MTTDKKRATLKTIAEALNITHTTVSNVFNRPEKVSPELRERVLAYTDSINYHGPAGAGRILRTGKCGTLGVIFNDHLSYVFSDRHDIALMRGIAEECEKNGINIALMPLKANNELKKRMMSAIVDGYILNATYNNDEIVQTALASGLPVVTTDIKLGDFACVSIDDKAAMRAVCQHLLAAGHRKFGIVAFPVNRHTDVMSSLADFPAEYDNGVAYGRVTACIKALGDAGVDLNSSFISEQHHSEAGGETAAKALLAQQPDITAIICLSDRFAFGVYQYCQSENIAVPLQLAITGFDDIEIKDPPIGLTTIRQPIVSKGREAARALIAEQLTDDIYLDFELIVRDSA